MKFAIGYQLPMEDKESVADLALSFPQVEEVYFPWVGMPSGRSEIAEVFGCDPKEAQIQLLGDLRKLKQAGKKLDLLLNANCYGGKAVDCSLEHHVRGVIEQIGAEAGGVDIVTTTSPVLADVVKTHFPATKVRASVNMRIGTVQGMEYIADRFDSFYMQREFNRDFRQISELTDWCKEKGKELLMLANSGCLNFCSGQTFHDNLVAHEQEITPENCMKKSRPLVCRSYLAEEKNRHRILAGSWIRPEDVTAYEPYFQTMKLATRMHQNPGLVVQAFCRNRYYGNLLNLLEPSYVQMFYPFIMNSSKLPRDWFSQVTNCDKRCACCGYCASVYEQIREQADFD